MSNLRECLEKIIQWFRTNQWARILGISLVLVILGALTLAPNWQHPLAVFSFRPLVFVLLLCGAWLVAWMLTPKRGPDAIPSAQTLPWFGSNKWFQTFLLALIIALLAALAWAPNWTTPAQILSLRPMTVILLGVGALAVAWAFVFRKLDFATRRKGDRDLVLIALVLLVALTGGIYLVGAAATFADPSYQAAAFRIIALWAMAYCAAGFLVGFLFGIPRVLQADAARPSDEYTQRVNTSLEQISDWLTKIIVGLGLTQLQSVPKHLYAAASWMARSFMPKDGKSLEQAASFSSSIIVFFLIVGFLAGYLMTRIYLSRVFRRSDTPDTTTASGVTTDDPAKKLRTFWKPDEKTADRVREEQLVDWMVKTGVSSPKKMVDIASFLTGQQYAQQRKEAVNYFNL